MASSTVRVSCFMTGEIEPAICLAIGPFTVRRVALLQPDSGRDRTSVAPGANSHPAPPAELHSPKAALIVPAMQLPRALAIMGAGLAAGLSARIAFVSPGGLPSAHRPGTGQQTQAGDTAAHEPAPHGPRPDTSVIFTASGGSRLRLLMAWLPGADDAALLHMADELAKDPTGDRLDIRLLMARWAEVSPAALVTWADRQRGGRDGFYVQNAIEAWARVDFDSAWAVASTERPENRGAALLGLTAVDPAKCLALLRADPALLGLTGFTLMGKVLTRIARTDPAGVASLLEGASVARLSSMGSSIALAWVQRDPAAAIEWLGSLPLSARGAVAEEAGEWLASHAPEQLSALLAALPAGIARTTIAAAGFENLAQRDSTAAQRQLDTMPGGPARQYCRALLMKQLIRAGDDAAAITLAGQLGWHVSHKWGPNYQATETGSSSSVTSGLSTDFSQLLGELIGRIAAHDPRQAADLLASGAGIPSRELFAAAAEHDPAALAAAMMARTGDPRAGENASHVISVWAAKDPAAAAAWITTNAPRGQDRASMEAALYSLWGSSDPGAMLRWTATRGPETNGAAWAYLAQFQRAYTAAHLPEFFASGQTQAVPNVLNNLPPAQQQEALRLMPDSMSINISRPMTNWLNREPEKASQWVRDLPPGARRDSAAAPLAQWLLSAGDYEAATHWSATLPAEQRASLLEQSFTKWSRTDPQAAIKAVLSAGLPPEEVVRLVELLENQSPPSP